MIRYEILPFAYNTQIRKTVSIFQEIHQKNQPFALNDIIWPAKSRFSIMIKVNRIPHWRLSAKNSIFIVWINSTESNIILCISDFLFSGSTVQTICGETCSHTIWIAIHWSINDSWKVRKLSLLFDAMEWSWKWPNNELIF